MTIEPFPMVYVAGPYRSNPIQNTARACRFGTMLLDAGVAAVVPHTTGSWYVVTPRPDQVWLDLGLAYVDRCEAVARLSGEGKRSDAEYRAICAGISIFEQGEEEADEDFAAQVIKWSVAVRGRPRVTLIVSKSGVQRVLVGFDEIWRGPGRVDCWKLLAVMKGHESCWASGVSVQEIHDEKYDRVSDAVLFNGREVGRWPAEGCYPLYVLENLCDAGAITLRVVGGDA